MTFSAPTNEPHRLAETRVKLVARCLTAISPAPVGSGWAKGLLNLMAFRDSVHVAQQITVITGLFHDINPTNCRSDSITFKSVEGHNRKWRFWLQISKPIYKWHVNLTCYWKYGALSTSHAGIEVLSSSQLDPASRTTVGKVSAIEDIQPKGIKIEAQWNHWKIF